MSEWLRNDYFIMFDVSRTTILPLREISKHLPLYKKKGEDIGEVNGPHLFTRAKLEKFGILDNYEPYEPILNGTMYMNIDEH